MIKIGNQGIDEIEYKGRISKVLKGIDLIWEVSDLVFEGFTKSIYRINISNSGAIKPGRTYTFATNDSYEDYVFSSGGKEYTINPGSTFTANQECEIKIKNTKYTFFDIKIYKTNEKATIIF